MMKESSEEDESKRAGGELWGHTAEPQREQFNSPGASAGAGRSECACATYMYEYFVLFELLTLSSAVLFCNRLLSAFPTGHGIR